MKKITTSWHNYRMIITILAGIRHLLKSDDQLNLATVGRQLEWVRGVFGYVTLGPFRNLAIWRLRRTEKAVKLFDFTGRNQVDGWTEAVIFHKDHVCELPTVIQVENPPALRPDEVFEKTKDFIVEETKRPHNKGKYADG